MAQLLVTLALDEEVLGLIPGRIYLKNNLFQIGSGLSVEV